MLVVFYVCVCQMSIREHKARSETDRANREKDTVDLSDCNVKSRYEFHVMNFQHPMLFLSLQVYSFGLQ